MNIQNNKLSHKKNISQILTMEEIFKLANLYFYKKFIRHNYEFVNLKEDEQIMEYGFDPGCYFIKKGSENAVITLERMK